MSVFDSYAVLISDEVWSPVAPASMPLSLEARAAVNAAVVAVR